MTGRHTVGPALPAARNIGRHRRAHSRFGAPALRRGFTLIESIASIVILAALGSVASAVILTAADGYLEASTSAQLHAEVSIALDRAVRELRKIELDATVVAPDIAPDIDDVTATSIAWTDIDDDAYQLALSGSDLTLQVDGGASAILLADVTAFTVKVYDESDTELATPLTAAACDPIRRVSLEVTLQRYGISETLRTKIFLRSTLSGGSLP